MRRSGLLAIVVLAVLAPAAEGATLRVGPLTPVSVPDPFPGGCGPAPRWPQADVESHLAVNPRDPRNMAVAWIEGTAPTVVTASTHDGGRSWRQAKVPGLHCTGDGDARGTGDPWLAFGPEGALYLTAGTIVGARDPAGTARQVKVVASSSLDGGRTWAPVTEVEDARDFNDKMALTPDPRRPGHAWIVWTKGRPGPDYASGDVRISATADGGRTWSASRAILDRPDRYPWGAELRVLPDGDLLVTSMVWQPVGLSEVPLPQRGNFEVLAVRSADAGATWSAPVEVAAAPAAAIRDPEDAKKVRANQGASTQVARDGTAYTAWWERGPGGRGRVVMSASRDGGASWTAPRAVGSATYDAFLPALAVRDDGAVAVTYYDLEEDVPGDGRLTTSLWFAQSIDGGVTWRETRIARAFDYRTAAEATGGLFLGDYFGLVATPGGFAAAPALPAPIAREGPSDIFFASVATGEGRPRLRLSVRPRRVTRGTRARFRFRVTGDGPVSGALVRFAGRRTRTDRRGRAVIVARLRRLRRYPAVAVKPGYRRARGAVGAVR